MNTIKLLRNEDIDIGLICNTELPKGIVYSPVKEIHDVFVASPEYLDNFYERANGRDQYSFADELSGNIKGNIIPLLNSGLASATHGDATDQGADKKSRDNGHSSGVSASTTIHNSSNSGMSNISTVNILEGSNLMVLEEANVTRTHVDEYLRSQGISCSQVLEINNMDLLIDFAAIGMGVASVVREFAQECRLRLLRNEESEHGYEEIYGVGRGVITCFCLLSHLSINSMMHIPNSETSAPAISPGVLYAISIS